MYTYQDEIHTCQDEMKNKAINMFCVTAFACRTTNFDMPVKRKVGTRAACSTVVYVFAAYAAYRLYLRG